MKNQLLYTPDGVRDIYQTEYEKKLQLEQDLSSVLKQYGYHPIQTPSFEFFDVFNKEFSSTSSKNLYKFFDHEGHTLVLRPDITPSIARCAATYFNLSETPLRFCYNGNTFINNFSYQGRLHERTQIGAELIGDQSVDADAEMIALSIHLLRASGLDHFQISIGHVDILNGLLEQADLGDSIESEVVELLANQNFYGVESLLSKLNLNEHIVALFSMLKNGTISKNELSVAKQYSEDFPKIFHALERLEELDNLLDYYEVKSCINYDLAARSALDYYTGIVFSGYTYGSGEPIVNGGRYDHLLGYFDSDAPATGFAVIVDQILSALNRQKKKIPLDNKIIWLLYTASKKKEAIREAQLLRKNGRFIEMIYIEDAKTLAYFESEARIKGYDYITEFVE